MSGLVQLPWRRHGTSRHAIAGLAMLLVLALPAVRGWLEATMTTHMLVQIPLLVAGGFVAAAALPAAARARVRDTAGGPLPLLLAAILASAWWMLPRALDAALDDPWAEVAKFISLPLLVGAPLALSWERLGATAKGFVWTNMLSMLAVLGWLYIAAPVRVCNNYLQSAQYDAGRWMIGIAIAGFLAWLVAWASGLRSPGRGASRQPRTAGSPPNGARHRTVRK